MFGFSLVYDFIPLLSKQLWVQKAPPLPGGPARNIRSITQLNELMMLSLNQGIPWATRGHGWVSECPKETNFHECMQLYHSRANSKAVKLAQVMVRVGIGRRRGPS